VEVTEGADTPGIDFTLEAIAVVADSDSDGLTDVEEALIGTDPNNPDTDSDGCSDGEELGFGVDQTGDTIVDERDGALRDPLNFWDFFDTPDSLGNRDKVVLGNDVVRVANRAFAFVDPLPDKESLRSWALSPPPSDPEGYHPAFDHSPPDPGDDPWDLNGPDGFILANDVVMIANQGFHSCANSP
jgi:hypothetical protein